ncbi:MAG: flagellin [Gemmatimonadetes bacterium]|jgi:flagellin|nr:flagellin [Gemmatimonadota bacterium]MBT4612021.1 flagellin [Gemmatimonadota bacterium]MBT5060463.1 flagellin [Gemmatimonadota bacterium]MBT5142566.1 flagellin [Gemmatimonadota bacterium]MBT5592079.1 flagellin [Gemmatimonadota bacterium]
MPLRVNNNIAAINSRRHLNANNKTLTTRLERLSSGLRVNRAADDAAGLAIREGMRAEIAGLRMNVLNAEQGTNLIQVAEGSLNEVNAVLIRMQELATQSSNSTVNDENREAIQAEFSQLTSEIDRIAQATIYNKQNLLTGFGNTITSASTVVTGSATSGVTRVNISGAQAGTYTFTDAGADSTITLGNGTVSQTISIGTILDGTQVATGTQVVANFDRLGVQVTLAGAGVAGATGNYVDGDLSGQNIIVEQGTGGSFQVGPKDRAFNRIEVNIGDMSATGNNLNMTGASVATISTSRTTITQIDSAILAVSQQRGELGAFQNRLNFTIAYTENEIENIQASEASISDADIAAEVTSFTRAQILSQAATAMLAQANVLPQNALSLLQ